jgi:hypothetical protein
MFDALLPAQADGGTTKLAITAMRGRVRVDVGAS